MDDIATKLIALAVLIMAVIYDWPRALAGTVVGFVARRTGYAWIWIPVGVVLVSVLGEVIYPLVGFSDGMSWNGFYWGILAAGVTAIGVFRVIADHIGPA